MKTRKLISMLLAANIAISTVPIAVFATGDPEPLKVTQWTQEVESGEENGTYTIYGPEISEELLQQTKNWDGSSVNDHLGSIYDFVWTSRGDQLPDHNQLWYDDTGLYSNILLSYYDEDGDFHRSPYVTQFRLVDRNGNYYYAYCADMNTGAHDDSQYELTNVKDAYYLNDTAKKHIQAITEKGFWGTVSGNGSLTAMKVMVSDEAAQYIDAGIALACTQAAIWYYANRSEDIEIAGRISTAEGYVKTDYFLQWWSNKGEWDYYDMTDEEQAASLELFNALINLTPSEPNTTDVIDASDIKNISIEVNHRDDTVYEVTEDTEIYDIDLNIEIDVDTDHINGDVLVTIYQGIDVDNNLIQVYQFDLTDMTPINSIYTIKNLKLQENLDIVITITGTQDLDSGAYLFTSMGPNSTDNVESQTFIGLVTTNSTRDVDLKTGIKFNVENDEPIPTPTPEVTEPPSESPESEDTPEPSAEPSETPVPSETPSESPDPEGTPEPSEEPKPSETPVPSETPQPTPTPEVTPSATPEPSETPAPEVTPTPSTTPEPDDTPKPSETPEPSNTPNPEPTPSETPVPSETPQPTPTHEVTPSTTPEPEDIPTPSEIPQPSNTPVPEVTPTPSVTPEPEDTPEPSEEPKPSETPTPEVTPVPEETPVPETTPTPTSSPTPTPSHKHDEDDTPIPTPTPTNTPIPEDTPEPSEEPKPSETPVNTPQPEESSSETPAPSETPQITPTPEVITEPEPTPTPELDETPKTGDTTIVSLAIWNIILSMIGLVFINTKKKNEEGILF